MHSEYNTVHSEHYTLRQPTHCITVHTKHYSTAHISRRVDVCRVQWDGWSGSVRGNVLHNTKHFCVRRKTCIILHLCPCVIPPFLPVLSQACVLVLSFSCVPVLSQACVPVLSYSCVPVLSPVCPCVIPSVSLCYPQCVLALSSSLLAGVNQLIPPPLQSGGLWQLLQLKTPGAGFQCKTIAASHWLIS